MPLDTSIYQNIKPFTMSDPLEQAGKLYTLQNAAMGMEKNRRAMAEEDAIRTAAQESGGDPEKLSAILLSRGHVDKGLSLRKGVRDEQKANLELKLKIAEGVGSDALALDSAYNQALQKHGGNAQAAVEEITPIYQQVRQKWASVAPLPEQFDPMQNRAGIGQAKDAVRYFTSQMPKFGSPVEATVDGKPALIQTDQFGGVRPVPGVGPKAPQTDLSRLIAARDALPQGHPDRARFEQAIQNETTAKRDRGTNVTVQAPGPMLPTKTTANKIDENVLETTQNLARLSTIDSMFKPHFQTLGTRAGMTWASIKEKSGVGLTVKEKSDLEEFSAYKRNAIDALNRYIKDITGAAMTDAEAQRILRGLPNPGSGLFDGDSPTEFKSKLDDAMKSAKVAVSRAAYLKRNGMSLEDGTGKGITLERMPALMNARGEEIEAKLKQENPGMTAPSMKRLVRRQLAVEFGLSSD